jgi:hypothetical protein
MSILVNIISTTTTIIIIILIILIITILIITTITTSSPPPLIGPGTLHRHVINRRQVLQRVPHLAGADVIAHGPSPVAVPERQREVSPDRTPALQRRVHPHLRRKEEIALQVRTGPSERASEPLAPLEEARTLHPEEKAHFRIV